MTEFERIMLLSEKWQITNDDDTLNYQQGRTIEENGWGMKRWKKGESVRHNDQLLFSIYLFT